MDETPLLRLARLAQLDGYELRRSASAEQYKAWGASLALFQGGHFKYAGHIENIRAWLHRQALTRP